MAGGTKNSPKDSTTSLGREEEKDSYKERKNTSNEVRGEVRLDKADAVIDGNGRQQRDANVAAASWHGGDGAIARRLDRIEFAAEDHFFAETTSFAQRARLRFVFGILAEQAVEFLFEQVVN